MERDGPHSQQPDYIPSPEDIAAACERIRRTWSDREYARRAPHLAKQPAKVPQLDVSGAVRRAIESIDE
jgi:hypothetical protein